MTLRTILTLILAVFTGASLGQNRADDAIVDMAQAFGKNNKARLTQLLPLARGHLLEPWAAYWELRARLDTASAQEVQEFFGRYAGTYQEDRLRNDWLLVLGQRRDWVGFAKEYPQFRMNDDREVRCYAILAQALAEGAATPPALVDEVRRLWLAQRDQDDGCTLAAGRLISDSDLPQRISALDAWRKARLAMEGNRPRVVAAAVEIIAPDALPLLSELNASPTKFLTRRVTAILRTRRELIGLALIKLATTDPDNAATLLENKWGLQLSSEERNWIWGVLGRQAAQRLQPTALGYFDKVSRDADLHDDMLAWRVRAALRASSVPHWKTVLTAIQAMSDELRKEPAWQYWRARALLAGGESQRAQALRILESLASSRGFYEMLALDELGMKVTAPARPAPLTDDEKEAARANPGLNRGLYAIGLGLREEGRREWNYTTNLARPGGMADRDLLAAAQLACERQVWDRCINTSERTKGEIDIDQRFPMPQREALVKRASDLGLDPAYVLGLIRQESRFVPDARSGVGAQGLMQVMPTTARWTARKLGIAGFTPEQLGDHATNLAIGTGYLKLVLDSFEGSMPLAAAAYNAGPSRPRVWRNGPVVEAAAWAESVPFAETRDYVKRVLANTTLYAALLTGEPQSLKARLGRVGPRDDNEAEPVRDLP
ncbi:MAG: lytic transglycosylase domain-containing protein [Ramlibacter sp.]